MPSCDRAKQFYRQIYLPSLIKLSFWTNPSNSLAKGGNGGNFGGGGVGMGGGLFIYDGNVSFSSGADWV